MQKPTLSPIHLLTGSKNQLLALLSVSAFLSACSMNPYILDQSMNNSLPPALSSPQFAGDLERAIKDVDAQRLAYYSALSSRTVQRNALSGGLIALSAGALYKGVTTDGGAGSRGVANLGALAGGAYALGTYSNSPNTELAYINAANDLSCLVLRTRPWLVTTQEYGAFTQTVANLASKTNALDALYQQQAAKSADPAGFVRKQSFERKIMHNARTALLKANNFDGFIKTAGFQLRQEAILVSNTAHLEIHRLQPDLANPSAVLAGLRNTSQAFRDIKPLDVPAADAQDDRPPNEPDPKPTPAAGAASPSNGSKSTPEASSTAASDLGKQADLLQASIDTLTKSLDKEIKSSKSNANATRDNIKKLHAELDTLNKKVTALANDRTWTVTATTSPLTQTDAQALATALSDVLAALRPVNEVLARAYALKPYVKNIPECQPLNAQAFEFTYDPGEVSLNPGQTFEVAVKGGVGIPKIWLSGAKGNDKDQMPEFTTYIDGGVARARLVLRKDTPLGEMHIMAVDGSGKQRDDIKVIVEAPTKK
jgi:hypothetical protein